MYKIFNWINNNKLKFLFIDSVLLIINIYIVIFVRNGIYNKFDFVYKYLATSFIFSVVLLIRVFWPKFTKKYNYFFIQTKTLDVLWKKILYIGVIISLTLNFVMLFLFWINDKFIEELIIIYFAIPWLILICVNGYTAIIKKIQE